MKSLLKTHFIAICAALSFSSASAADLADHFISPTRESGASLYMCWPYGNVTAEGLKREMAAYGKMPIVAVDLEDRAHNRRRFD